LLAPLLLKEKADRRDLLMMCAIAFGLALFFVELEPATKSAPNPFAGNVCGVAAGVTYAATLLGLRWLEKSGAGALGAVVIGNVFACVLALPFALPVNDALAVDWAIVAYLGVIQIGLAYVLLTRGLAEVPAFETSLIILAEPTLSPLWAWLFQGEVPSALALAGGAIILAASTSKSWRAAEPADGT
jgi:drug/metabolite transporter (DMT)-like permease